MVLEDLNPELRLKVITIITIDVHAKDVVDKFVQKKIADSQIFAWQSQLKFYWLEEGQEVGGAPSNKPDVKRTCMIKICDWVTAYSYE
jgi:dynein heavy chain